MKFKPIITVLFLALLSNVTAQNCVQINETNINNINNIISDISSNGGGCIEIESGNYNLDFHQVYGIILKSNVSLKIQGNLSRTYNILSIKNCENINISGNNVGALNFTGTNKTSKGIEIENSKNINIEGLKISGFIDKGILVRGYATNIKIKDNFISGAVNDSTGVGIAITDEELGGVSFCNIESNTVFENRIGISVNKSKYITITGNHSYNNFYHGIGLDGDVSLSGDGAQNCIISYNQVYKNGGVYESGKTKSGIYLGNGSQKNIVSNNITKNNSGPGILYFEEENNQNSSYNNSFISNQIIDNREWGIKLVNSQRTIISNNQIIQNGYLTETDEQGNVTKQGTGGILLQDSNKNIVSANNIILNGQIGIKHVNSTGNNVETNIIDGQPMSTNH